MLVLYSTFLNFPGGGPAANFSVGIWLHASNQMALLFTDQTGDTPAPNPLTTDGDGQVVFWAAPGDYEALLAGERFHIPVDETFDEPTWPDLWVHDQSTPATVWTIEHHFGVRPQVDVILSGELAEAAVSHPDDETTTITFGAQTTGTAHLRR